MEAIRDFVGRAWPTPGVAAAAGVTGLLIAGVGFAVTAALKQRGWRTGDTRKLFHFVVFGAAAAVQAAAGFAGVVVFGAAVSLLVGFAVLRGEGHPWFEAIARESDAPHRRWYVVVPWFATALGGIAANLLFRDTAIHGYLVVGFADAVAEPIGSRFGRHRYRVPLPGRVVSTRSLEGSAAVFVASCIAIGVAQAIRMHLAPGTASFDPARIVLVALLVTLVEAAAPHGWDNFFLQLAASGLAAGLLAG